MAVMLQFSTQPGLHASLATLASEMWSWELLLLLLLGLGMGHPARPNTALQVAQLWLAWSCSRSSCRAAFTVTGS